MSVLPQWLTGRSGRGAMTFAVFVEQDRVVIDLGYRRRDVLMSCSEAESFVAALRAGANGAEQAPPSVIKGENWSVGVQSYDGQVACRFTGPGPGYPRQVPLTAAAARMLADRVQFKAQQAAYRMRIEVRPGPNFARELTRN